jgi:hypothetical protein
MPARSALLRSIKYECLNRVIPFGDRHLRRTIAEFVEHYGGERNHQGLDELIDGAPTVDGRHRIRRGQRLGGLLNYSCQSISALGNTRGQSCVRQHC